MALTFGDTGNIDVPSAETLLNASAFSICFWFRTPQFTTENQHIFSEDGSEFDRQCRLVVRDSDLGTDPGELWFFYRADNFNDMLSGIRVDDDTWYRAFIVRRSSTDYEMYVDGTSQATLTTDTGTNSGETLEITIGNLDADNEGFRGDIARFAVWVGTALTLQEAETFLWTGRYATVPNYWAELQTTGVRDLSGNGVSFTVTGTSVVDHAPTPNPFGVGGAAVRSAAVLIRETLTEGFTATDSPSQTIPQMLRPDGDLSVGSWTDEGGATSNLFQSIDEVDPDDADYVEGP